MRTRHEIMLECDRLALDLRDGTADDDPSRPLVRAVCFLLMDVSSLLAQVPGTRPVEVDAPVRMEAVPGGVWITRPLAAEEAKD